MDTVVAARLNDQKNNHFFDAELSKKLGTTARQYLDAGMSALNYTVPDFDAATDLVEMLAPIENEADFAKTDRNSAVHFRHPLTFVEMVTLTTFVAQILFGGEQARSVEAQGENDAAAADAINALLAWNDAKTGIYLQGWLWLWNAIVYNRGVWYESVQPNMHVEKEEVEEDDITKPQVPLYRKDGVTPVMKKGEPVMGYQKRIRIRNKRRYDGMHNHLDLVSPYDFICDTQLPISRFQEGRYAGHRVMIEWMELERRSSLDPSDDAYVLPGVVAKIKSGKGGTAPAPIAATTGPSTSRTYYERRQRGQVTGGLGAAINAATGGGSDSVNKDDGGTVECWVLYIRAKPKTLGLYDDEELELIRLLITSTSDVLSAVVCENQHDEFPYAVGEGRPHGHRQLSPGWALAVKPCQDRVDHLNNTHADAQARMGNILLIDNTKCDPSTLLARDKNGTMIFRTELGRGAPAEEIVKQIPLQDTTASYNDEMDMWEKTAENVTGAHAFIQGQTEDPSQTLGQFDAVRQMAVGRISSIARCLSESAIRPQTRRFVENFKQFMPNEQVVRISGKGQDFDPDNPPKKYQLIKRTDIQCGYDVTAHDGSLPGADAKIVAAASRAIEAFASNEALASAFDNAIPGALDATRIFRDLLSKSGLPIEKYSVTREQAQRNAQAKMLSNGTGLMPGMTMPGAPTPPMPTGAGNIPSAAMPPIPSAAPPQLTGVTT